MRAPLTTLLLAGLMAERYPVYAKADITIDSVDGPHDAVVDKIVGALMARGVQARARSQARA